jgi:hypothetical protein
MLASAALGQAQTDVQLDNLRSKTPAGWKAQEPSSKFRQYQFMLPKADGDTEDAELYVTDFGGGGLEANIGRWKGMFVPPEGKSIEDVTKIEKFKVGNAEAVLVDVQGTYKTKFPPFAPNAKEIIKPSYRRINVVINGPEKQYFLILSGPQATIAKHHKDFESWVKSFK